MKLRSLLPFVSLLLAACSSEESSTTPPVPCNQDPWQCPAGQTCWPKDNAGTWACLNSKAGAKKGDPCVNTFGTATCGDGLACFQGIGAPEGSCVSYCDNAKPGRGCATGETCSGVLLAGTATKFMICIGPPPASDAGTDTGGSGDTGTSGGDTGTGTDVATDGGSD